MGLASAQHARGSIIDTPLPPCGYIGHNTRFTHIPLHASPTATNFSTLPPPLRPAPPPHPPRLCLLAFVTPWRVSSDFSCVRCLIPHLCWAKICYQICIFNFVLFNRLGAQDQHLAHFANLVVYSLTLTLRDGESTNISRPTVQSPHGDCGKESFVGMFRIWRLV